MQFNALHGGGADALASVLAQHASLDLTVSTSDTPRRHTLHHGEAIATSFRVDESAAPPTYKPVNDVERMLGLQVSLAVI